jgi:hypothetical protein
MAVSWREIFVSLFYDKRENKLENKEDGKRIFTREKG